MLESRLCKIHFMMFLIFHILFKELGLDYYNDIHSLPHALMSIFSFYTISCCKNELLESKDAVVHLNMKININVPHVPGVVVHLMYKLITVLFFAIFIEPQLRGHLVLLWNKLLLTIFLRWLLYACMYIYKNQCYLFMVSISYF